LLYPGDSRFFVAIFTIPSLIDNTKTDKGVVRKVQHSTMLPQWKRLNRK